MTDDSYQNEALHFRKGACEEYSRATETGGAKIAGRFSFNSGFCWNGFHHTGRCSFHVCCQVLSALLPRQRTVRTKGISCKGRENVTRGTFGYQLDWSVQIP